MQILDDDDDDAQMGRLKTLRAVCGDCGHHPEGSRGTRNDSTPDPQSRRRRHHHHHGGGGGGADSPLPLLTPSYGSSSTPCDMTAVALRQHQPCGQRSHPSVDLLIAPRVHSPRVLEAAARPRARGGRDTGRRPGPSGRRFAPSSLLPHSLGSKVPCASRRRRDPSPPRRCCCCRWGEGGRRGGGSRRGRLSGRHARPPPPVFNRDPRPLRPDPSRPAKNTGGARQRRTRKHKINLHAVARDGAVGSSRGAFKRRSRHKERPRQCGGQGGSFEAVPRFLVPHGGHSGGSALLRRRSRDLRRRSGDAGISVLSKSLTLHKDETFVFVFVASGFAGGVG
ncbi:unnamed protein product [Lampetra fluviatilis]